MNASRITAIALVAAAALWIASGYLLPREQPESRASIRPAETAGKLFRVGYVDASAVPHSRTLLLSGRTEAERKVTAIARTGGVLTELRVRRGSRVEKGDVIAVLSDEAREAQVAQAQALVDQRKTELEAKRRLIEVNALPRLELANLEAQYKAAQATLAAAEAEHARGVVRAPWSGIVTEVTAEVGGAAFSMAGKEIAEIVALEPMLAVAEASERNVSDIKVGDEATVRMVNGQTATGRIRFVSKSASKTTRTYRIEVELPNPDGAIPDGITAEIAVKLAPIEGTRVPRSAMTFSSEGKLGLRTVRANGVVEFVPVKLIEDELDYMWVGGIADGARVIVRGQDFVRDGQRVEAVAASTQSAPPDQAATR